MTDLQECIGGMEMEKFYLGFDAGTQSVKVTVYNEEMECVASTSAPTTLTYPHPGWVDMDVDEYLALTVSGMAECSFFECPAVTHAVLARHHCSG